MQEHIELDDLTIQRYFKKMKAFEEVYKSLTEYKNDKIDIWFVYYHFYLVLAILIQQFQILCQKN